MTTLQDRLEDSPQRQRDYRPSDYQWGTDNYRGVLAGLVLSIPIWIVVGVALWLALA